VLIFIHLFFVLVFNLLPLPLVPALYSPTESGVCWLHVIFLPCKSAGLQLPPSCCFVLDYPFINQILFFLPPTVLMWVFACVSLSLWLEFLLSWSVSVQLQWLVHSPPSPRIATTLLADNTLLWLFTSHTLPYINSVSAQHSLLYMVGKLFKKILLARILIEVSKHWLMQDEQFGFQPKHSMSLLLARLTEKITRNFGKKRLTGVAILDVAKAFDTVWISGLLNLPPYLVKTTSKNHISGVGRSKRLWFLLWLWLVCNSRHTIHTHT